jgi:hypothetical protein
VIVDLYFVLVISNWDFNKSNTNHVTVDNTVEYPPTKQLMGQFSVCPVCKRLFLNERALKSHLFHRNSKCKHFFSQTHQYHDVEPEIHLQDSNTHDQNLLDSTYQSIHEDGHSDVSMTDDRDR